MNHLKKIAKFEAPEFVSAQGIFSNDWDAVSHYQRDCTRRFSNTLQLEQETYFTQHPEVKAMMSMFISHAVQRRKIGNSLELAGEYFGRPSDIIEKEILEMLKNKYFPTPPEIKQLDMNLYSDLIAINCKHFGDDLTLNDVSMVPPSLDTLSSSFISIVTSDTTLPTPEPVPTPEPTFSEVMYGVVSTAVDKAVFLHVDDRKLRYDCAYVELMKAVEEAMEIPVTDIKQDIAVLYYNAYKLFELDIIEKERQAAEYAWNKRMRKKLKKTLRRQDNFKGYVSPRSSKSEISTHESYAMAPPSPCKCQPKCQYNRYKKDRFGLYLPSETQYSVKSTTTSPAFSLEESPASKKD